MNLRRNLKAPRPDEPAPEGGGGGNPPPAPPPPAPALVRPEGLGDDYWDAEKGVKFDAILPKLQAHDDYSKGVIQKVEDIDWTLPADLEEGQVYELNKDDPMLAAIGGALVENKASQPLVSALTAAYAKAQIAEVHAAREALRAEEKKLGDKFQDRIAGAFAYVESVVGKEKAERFRNSWVTAEQVEIIEALAAKASGPTAATPEPNAPNSESPGRTFYGGMPSSESAKK